MKFLFLFLSFIFSFCYSQDAKLEKAFHLLNEIRKSPSNYSELIGINLSAVESSQDLKWNDTLAQVAYLKAKEMAEKKYFNHVDKKGYGLNYYINKSGYKLPKDWLNKKSNNYFESICAGELSPEKGIIFLLNDQGEKKHKKAGHRVHLLSMSDFYKPNVDIGIGWYESPNSVYSSYMVVVIARHSW